MGLLTVKDGTSDPILTRMANEDKVPWYKKKNLRLMYLWLFLCCMGVEMTSGFDSQLINTLQFSSYFLKYFGDGHVNADGGPAIEPGLLGFVSSCYQLGSIIAVPIAPWFNQKYGRRWAIMVGSITMVIGAIIQGFSQHVGMYIVARMILGMGILFCIIAGAALIGELGHPKERAFLTSFFNASYFIGSILASAITLRTVEIENDWAWRLPSLLQIVPSVLQIATVFLLPESPRWLASKDRDEEAWQILVHYHAEDDADSLLAKAEMAQIKSTIQLEFESSKQTWAELFKTAGMRRRIFITIFIGIFTQMSGNTLLSYYSGLLFTMMGYTTSYAKSRINLANNCWSFMNAMVLALIVPRFPRRIMYMISAASMCLVFISMTISFERLRFAKNNGFKNQQASIAALFFYFAYSPCYNMGNNALTYTYLVELWPYAVRSRGIGVMQIWGKLAGFFSTNVNPKALTAIDWKYLAIYCGWIFFELSFIYFFYPETHGRTLEELTFLFEDKDLADRAIIAVEKQIHHDDSAERQDVTEIQEENRQKNLA